MTRFRDTQKTKRFFLDNAKILSEQFVTDCLVSFPWINVSGLSRSGKIQFLLFPRQSNHKRARFLFLLLKAKLESLSVTTQCIHRPRSNTISFLHISLSEVPPCQYCIPCFCKLYFFLNTSLFWFSFIIGFWGMGINSFSGIARCWAYLAGHQVLYCMATCLWGEFCK